MNLRRFNLVADEEAAKKVNRDYMRAHRDVWSSLGFRNVTYMVHDSERDLILAELDVRRCDKLIELSLSKDTDMDTLEIMSRRNMPKSPDAGSLAELMEAIEESTARKEAKEMVDIAQNMLKRQARLLNAFNKTDDRNKRVRYASRGVAYSSAAAARFKLAKVIVEWAAKRPTSIFGINGSVATTIADEWEAEN